ncbi:MAG: cytochrome d ubiquinol oxidase subunit II [Solirubrobacteraceae bacterium]
MHLYELPLVFALVGLVFYVVLAGADFGAGFWQLLAGGGEAGGRVRDHAHDSMAPVWEANHVWLIFVLTVLWTAYPRAFGAIASTLSIPLFIAVIGIILRGAAYALRAGAKSAAEQRPIDAVFAVSSILTPFALGTMIGAIASRRVPVGNAAGGLFSSWLAPTPILVGVLAVATSAYLAAVFLAADAARLGERELEVGFRRRALGAGVIAGALAIAGLVVLHSDAHALFHRLLHSAALGALIASILAGSVTLELVRRRRFELARYSAAVAVAAVIAGWALAQSPTLLPGLSVRGAAAPHDTLVALVVAVIGGGAILFPSLALLFRLVLKGRLDHGASSSAGMRGPGAGSLLSVSAGGLLVRLAVVCLLAGFGFLSIAEAGWAHLLGALALFGFLISGFLVAAAPLDEP